MKQKRIVVMLVVALIMASAVLMGGCGDKYSVVGRWEEVGIMYEGQYMSYEEYPELALGGDFNYIRVYDDGTFERLMSMFMIEGVWEKTESDLADHVYLLKSQQSRMLDDEWQEADSMYYLLLDEENPDVIELMWLDDAGDSEMTYVYERVYSAE